MIVNVVGGKLPGLGFGFGLLMQIDGQGGLLPDGLKKLLGICWRLGCLLRWKCDSALSADCVDVGRGWCGNVMHEEVIACADATGFCRRELPLALLILVQFFPGGCGCDELCSLLQLLL